MKKKKAIVDEINSVAALNERFGITETLHPLISIIDLKGRECIAYGKKRPIVLNLYSMWMKKGVHGLFVYGEGKMSFEQGTLIFLAPRQVLATHAHYHEAGWGCFFHPDLLKGYFLDKTIRSYDFFSYANRQALYLSQADELLMKAIVDSLQKEIVTTADRFSQEVIVSQLYALFAYANRLYHTQRSATDKSRSGLPEQVDELLLQYFNSSQITDDGLPTVHYLSGKLHLSPGYLTDKLKETTGQTAVEYISAHLIEKAKELISTTSLSAGEIAFRLGYKHSQSFSKLFRKKTGCSPVAYRRRFQTI